MLFKTGAFSVEDCSGFRSQLCLFDEWRRYAAKRALLFRCSSLAQRFTPMARDKRISAPVSLGDWVCFRMVPDNPITRPARAICLSVIIDMLVRRAQLTKPVILQLNCSSEQHCSGTPVLMGPHQSS